MRAIEPSIESIEKRIEFLIEDLGKGLLILPPVEVRTDKEYSELIEKTDYWYFIQSADQHYFISRILFHHEIGEYSRFCGFQCIENYLKAYLKFKNQIPKNTHKLSKDLLPQCRKVAPSSDTFVHEDKISLIIALHEPFYELARYPVQKSRPQYGAYGFTFPDDIFMLDYFVYKMRQILSVPERSRDILKDGHNSLYQCQRDFPDLYNLFFLNNINFVDDK